MQNHRQTGLYCKECRKPTKIRCRWCHGYVCYNHYKMIKHPEAKEEYCVKCWDPELAGRIAKIAIAKDDEIHAVENEWKQKALV